MIEQASHIVEGCPVCGRRVTIQCQYFGRQVVCQHCGGQFVATENGAQTSGWMAKCDRLMEAADRLLEERAERRPASYGRRHLVRRAFAYWRTSVCPRVPAPVGKKRVELVKKLAAHCIYY